ncbi:hypothetical protein NP493_11g02031 [Ridgeia piscesae]|uniref:Exosome complex component N-terminal domain-containing protein n=1 Tax=Ridgeia piscesae TaxID=27915 RepID=A0AAD9PEX3_RIDPI|nr:hypothetical protein NP493_11g02031 [Ridgeia piscesae]
MFWVHFSGQRIDKLDGKHTAGKGTYSKNGFIIASLAGFVHHTQKDGDMTEIEVRTEVEDGIVPSVNSYRDSKGKMSARQKRIRWKCTNVFALVTPYWPEFEEGFTMVPISWCEMKCPKSHSTEFRKVAKLRPEYIEAPGIS